MTNNQGNESTTDQLEAERHINPSVQRERVALALHQDDVAKQRVVEDNWWALPLQRRIAYLRSAETAIQEVGS